MTLTHVGAVLGAIVATGVLLIVGTVRSGHAVAAPSPTSRRAGRLHALIEASGLAGATVPRLVAVSALAAVVAGLLAVAVTGVAVVGVPAATVGGIAPVALLRHRVRRRQRARRACWPEAVDAMAAGVRAGLALPDAAASLSTRGPELLRADFTAFAVEYRATGSLSQALDVLQQRLSDPVGDRVVAALRMARQSGGTDLGSVLRSLSTMLREDARIRAEIEARQSWTVAAARMAVAAPWLTLALLCTRPEVARAYATPVGALVIGASAALCAVAYRVMMRIGRLPTDERVRA